MIKEKIYELLQLNEDLPIPEDIFKEFSESVVYGLQRQVFSERQERGTLRLSQIGRCVRQQWYMVKKYPTEPLNPRAKMTFLFGDIVEAVVVALAKASGVNLHSEQKEVDFNGVKGHIDGLITVNGEDCLFECKSMSDAGFKTLERNGLEDDFGYLSQVNSYLHCLGLNRAFLVAVNKNTGHITEVEVKKSDKLVKEIEKNITTLRECIQNDTLPDRKYKPVEEIYRNKPTGRMILPVQCAYCGYKDYCWNNLQQDFKNNRPIWVVEEDNND